MTLQDIKRRIDEAEAEYSAARKGSAEHSLAGAKLKDGLEEAINEITVFLDRGVGLVKDSGADARNRRSLEEYRQMAALRREEVVAELSSSNDETNK